MNIATLLDFVNLFLAGILAGALFVIDYGVGPAMATILNEQAHIQVRQAMIRSLRVLVPAIFIPTILSGIAITVLDGFASGFVIRLTALLVVITCFLLTLLGTAPINSTVLTWQPSMPPKNWQTMVSQWERLDRARTLVGIAAFALFLVAIALKLLA